MNKLFFASCIAPIVFFTATEVSAQGDSKP